MSFWIAAGSQIVEAVALVLAAEAAQPEELALPEGTRLATSAGITLVDLGIAGGEKIIARSPDGLFYITARVNGAAVRFLVDTGATTIVLTTADAARAGVLPRPDEFRHTARTAGGVTAMARVRLSRMSVGPAERRDVDAAITGSGLGVSLLGQSWLSQMGSVTIAGDRMVLRDGPVPVANDLPPARELNLPATALPVFRQGYAEFDFRDRLPRGSDTKKRPRIAPGPQYYLKA